MLLRSWAELATQFRNTLSNFLSMGSVGAHSKLEQMRQLSGALAVELLLGWQRGALLLFLRSVLLPLPEVPLLFDVRWRRCWLEPILALIGNRCQSFWIKFLALSRNLGRCRWALQMAGHSGSLVDIRVDRVLQRS